MALGPSAHGDTSPGRAAPRSRSRCPSFARRSPALAFGRFWGMQWLSFCQRGPQAAGYPQLQLLSPLRRPLGPSPPRVVASICPVQHSRGRLPPIPLCPPPLPPTGLTAGAFSGFSRCILLTEPFVPGGCPLPACLEPCPSGARGLSASRDGLQQPRSLSYFLRGAVTLPARRQLVCIPRKHRCNFL